MQKISVIIPTLLKDRETLSKLISQLEKDSVVSEVILINNARKVFKHSFSKLREIVPKKNQKLYVNQSWNLGVKEAKEDYYVLFNDDLLICNNFCSQVLNLIQNLDNFGCLGMDNSSVINTSDVIIPEETIFSINIDDKERKYGWGTIIFGKKELYKNIPEKIKIWCGDDYIRYVAKMQNKDVYALVGAKIFHLGGLSSSNSKLRSIEHKDILEYSKIDKSFKKTEPYRAVKRYYSLKNVFIRFCQGLFSMGRTTQSHSPASQALYADLKSP